MYIRFVEKIHKKNQLTSSMDVEMGSKICVHLHKCSTIILFNPFSTTLRFRNTNFKKLKEKLVCNFS